MDEVLLYFRLIGDEARALRELSAKEWREPRDQARFILRCKLERCGLLAWTAKFQETAPTTEPTRTTKSQDEQP